MRVMTENSYNITFLRIKFQANQQAGVITEKLVALYDVCIHVYSIHTVMMRTHDFE